MVLFVVLCSIFVTENHRTTSVQAASDGLNSYKKITTYQSQKIGKTIYSVKYNDSTRKFTIYAKTNGKSRVLIRDCRSDSIITNGKYIYYAVGNYVSYGYLPEYTGRRLVRYTISSGKTSIIKSFSGKGWIYAPFACDGTYLYFGMPQQYGGAYDNFSVLNLKNKKTIYLKSRASNVQKVKNKLLVSGTNFPHGAPLYLINKNGSGQKYITKENVIEVSIKGNYIYYTEATYTWSTRKCRCDLNGNNQVALTKWS